jgi:hypothetical protein
MRLEPADASEAGLGQEAAPLGEGVEMVDRFKNGAGCAARCRERLEEAKQGTTNEEAPPILGHPKLKAAQFLNAAVIPKRGKGPDQTG